ncbi:unnamed protein product [Boreogadus saida]
MTSGHYQWNPISYQWKEKLCPGPLPCIGSSRVRAQSQCVLAPGESDLSSFMPASSWAEEEEMADSAIYCDSEGHRLRNGVYFIILVSRCVLDRSV